MSISPVAISLPTLNATEDEVYLVETMLKRLGIYQVSNKLKEAYYEGEQRVRHLGISIPPHLTSLEVVVGWAGTTVDVLDERLEWQGWSAYGGDDFGLGDIYNENALDIDSGLGHLDALIHGTSFVALGTGFDGEPQPLITVESARNMTGIYDPRIRRLSSALAVNKSENGQAVEVTLYLPNQNVYLQRTSTGWHVVERDIHNLGRVLVAQMFNRPRASRMGGRSEISRAIRSYTDQGVRTLLGMEINREFYSAPQRYMLGADADMFTDENGNPIPGWEALMSKMLVAPNNEDGQIPQVGQFTASSPAPYLEQMKGLAQLVAAEAAIPASYLGFVSDNPTSADAIRQAEARLVKRAERRQLMFGRTWLEVGRLALLVRDGSVPDEFNQISVKWRDAATPTRSAAADSATKLIGSGVLPPDSSVTYDRIGLDPHEQRQLEVDKRRARANARLDTIASLASTETQPSGEVNE